MENLTWNLFRYHLPFKRPLKMLGREIHSREGLILQFRDENEVAGTGEIAPLQGIHLESLDEAEAQLVQLLERPETCGSLFPSVRFGLEMAWHLMRNKYPSSIVPLSKSIRCVPVNALITPDEEDLPQAAQRVRKKGFQAVKLKVGGTDMNREIQRVRELRKHLDKSVSLRLDANRAWRLDQALEFAEGIHGTKIEYCEEPLENPEQLKTLAELSGMPLALDETLWETRDPDSLPWDKLNALVLKPSRLGGWKACQIWIDSAQRHRLRVTFSSCMESGLGLTWIALMNAVLIASPTPAGLDTFQVFIQDLSVPAFRLKQGSFIFPEKWPRLDRKCMLFIASGKFRNAFPDKELQPFPWTDAGSL